MSSRFYSVVQVVHAVEPQLRGGELYNQTPKMYLNNKSTNTLTFNVQIPLIEQPFEGYIVKY